MGGLQVVEIPESIIFLMRVRLSKAQTSYRQKTQLLNRVFQTKGKLYGIRYLVLREQRSDV